MFPPVFQWLKASAAVKAIVGTNPPHIYDHGRAPQTGDGKPQPSPYITWFVVAAEPANNLSDPPPVDKFPVQIDCWHQTRAGVISLASAVRDAMELQCHCTGLIADLQEPDTLLYRIGLTFDIWHGRV